MKRRNKIYTGAAIAALLMGSAVAVPQTLIPNATITASAATAKKCGDWEYEEIESAPDTAKLTNYTGTDESVSIPETIDGHNVTQLASNLFKSNINITRVVIPTGIIEIPNLCFWGAENLESVDIPQSVKTIGFRAFSNTPKLDSVYLPTALDKIGACAFASSGISNISIPSATEIGNNAFANCKNLKSITLPNNLKTLEYKALEGCIRLESVTLPESLTCISSSLFAYCESLKSITIPNSIERIESNAFEKCSALTSITIPETVNYLATGCFSESGLTEFESRAELKIESGAFVGANNLTKVTLSGKETLGSGAFAGCENLSNLVVPISGNLKWSYDAFDGCEKLFYINNKEVNCSYNKEKKDMVFDRNELYPFIHKYFNASEKVGFVDKYVKKYCEGIVEQEVKPGMTKLQIAKALHDWVIGKVYYDSADTDAPRNHCDVSIFLNEKTVCDGYARGYSILMENAGFESSYYSNGDHAWNKIKIGDLCFNVDTTWDDSAKPDYEWFMLSGKEVVEKEAVSHKGANDDYPYSGIPMGDLNMDKVIDETDIEFLKNNSDTLNDNQKILADLNFNGEIDDEDLILLGKKYDKRFDLNNDGKINNNDLALLQFIRKAQIEFVKNVIYKADNNNDGLIDSKDVKEMTYYLKKYCNQESNEYYRMGDLNLDGTVDKNDLIALQKYGNKHISFKASSKLADLNCDGIADELDYNLLKEMTKYQLGDVDLNGTVDSADRDLIMNYILKKSTLSRKALWYADLNDDCVIDVKDIVQLCRDYNIPDYQLGDVDFNGKVDKADKDLIMNHIANIELLPNVALGYADVNRDGDVNVFDVVELCRDYNITD